MRNKLKGILLSLALLTQLAVFPQSQHIQLEWKLAPESDVPGVAVLSSPQFQTGNWVDAIVPGTVFHSYVAAGREKNPDYGENIYKVDQSKYNKPYWYRTKFSGEKFASGKQVWLNFHGVNKRAEIFLNGKPVASITGLMRRAKFNITQQLNKNTNVLLVLIVPPLYKATHGQGLANREAPSYLSSAGWDWMPAVPGYNSGITDSVTLTTTGNVSVEDPWIKTVLPDNKHADLAIEANLRNAADRTVSGVLSAIINPGNIKVSRLVTVDANGTINVAFNKDTFPQLSLQNPRLWWPNGYGGKSDGTQHLYTCKLEFRENGVTSEVLTKTFGIRKVSADTTSLNGPLRLYINDVPILIKGGNWGMSDYMLKVRGKDYEPRIRLHKEMNYNMIRNWTGEVTDEAFYDYCDQYGIMVWDDFWLNNFGPIDSLQVFRVNAIQKVKTFRNHPSIVIWCGANEGVPGGDPDGSLNMAIKNAVLENDLTDKLYIPRSNAGITNPNFSIQGGSRNFSGSGLWGNVDPRTYFTDPRNGYLFSKDSWGMRSELGMATFVNAESFKKFMPKEYWQPPTPESVDSKTNMWARHFFSTHGELGGGATPVRYINDIKQSYGPSNSLEDFCRKAQLLNLETMKAMYEAWNDHMWKDASGMLIWMSQSAYPSMIWQTYDYYFDLTGAYFGAKSGCEPIHIQWNPATSSVKVINNKPYTLNKLIAEAEVYNLNGRKVPSYDKRKVLDVPATSATEAFIALQQGDETSFSDVYFLKLKLKDSKGKLLSENLYWIGKKYQDYNRLNDLPSVKGMLSVGKPRIGTAVNKVNKVLSYTVRNRSTKAAAFGIRAQLLRPDGSQILPAIISDSYFALMQGESKELKIEVEPSLLVSGYRLALEPYNDK
ncbi:glycosyl hydrolase family 2 [Arcticibacter tournemirensis]|uniref:Beta-mannosidase n=1 Tax=Arcticibacter tournemirensis TaxID=699437 RepID=A0A5M9H1T7_9SPHI|nr:glycoside hydrolase family 2 TIM barrel-domain containing protein [Arcticibacter tournemirensis]KAA8479094.1 beta-mannosidase [Arcticibacter tournemirensis]TQM48653.1 glycosyl hydrolase family 2 [Arcticibacter tournemirensis]